ncbi:hypothetical protein [Sporosarcina highlanderae]|uniref:DUF1797 family protein n=1 Tax=Sporosarcina highlanderae TaxID=3035916 RepID=A0ABT8JSQ6_9BACL|nr:hypothetical protein [Sporosarcina highlanderae]MDN4607184.1 hypothetical protein [Sporosarcina highlanderae]
MKFIDTKFQLKIEMLKAMALMDKAITVKEINHNQNNRELIFTSEYWIADGPISQKIVLRNEEYNLFEQAVTIEDVCRIYEIIFDIKNTG